MAALVGRSTYIPVNCYLLIVVDELMILSGLVMPLTSGIVRAAVLLLACSCFLFVIYHSVRALLDIALGTEMTTMVGLKDNGINPN
jgi:hypothetical protein